jgi:hypothetical protein
MLKTKVAKFIEFYLETIGITDAIIEEIFDEMGLVLNVSIPKSSKGRIGILKGKKNANLAALIRLTQVIGLMEGKKPLLVIRLKD